jgi:DNA mismatch endonuclease, patch repair protein
LDPLTQEERSYRMSLVRGSGNKSTELAVESALNEARIGGWVKHPSHVRGRPDFYFPDQRLAVFVDGCFWHACPRCRRRTPATRADFWFAKIDENRRRDNRVRRRLRQEGFHVIRVWEHEISTLTWLRRLCRMLDRHSK